MLEDTVGCQGLHTNLCCWLFWYFCSGNSSAFCWDSFINCCSKTM